MSIKFCPDCRQFFLEGRDFSYIIAPSAEGCLQNRYFGSKLPHGSDLSYYKAATVASFNGAIPGSKSKFCDYLYEYPTPFIGDYRESAISTVDADGCRVSDLRYAGYELLDKKPPISSGIPSARGGETLAVDLTDGIIGLRVRLYYTVYSDENIITRRAEIINESTRPIRIDRAMSASFDFFDDGYELFTLYGHHAKERYPERTPLRHGRESVGNTRGATSANHAPFAAVMRHGVDEENGEVIAVALSYSGSHYESAEIDESGRVRLMSGINPESFEWKLDPGERFETPEAVICYSCEGIGGMSRSYHDFFRSYVISEKFVKSPRPVVLNSWEGMHFTFDRDRLFETIDALPGTGIDTFVLDDGWFGARNNDRAGLGDWFVNEEKLPGGLMAVADRCHERGLHFGLWIEPEMVNPDSDLYRAHPEWAISAPGREPVLSRNQCILDFSRSDVVEYIKKVMCDVIAASGADYIKWDMNRSMTENWSHALPADREGELQHRYILGVYELARCLTETFPDILFEGCSGGGGRYDGAMLAYFPQIWTSDDSDAHERTKIQYGTCLVYPLSSSSNHVSLSPNIRNGRIISMSTRTNVAYGGAFGYEFDLKKVPENELSRIPADVERYRGIEDLIQNGDLYRLRNTQEGNEMLQAVVAKDKSRAVLTYYQALNPHKLSPRITVPGLDGETKYLVNELGITLTGEVLRRVGLVLPRFKHDFASVTLTLTAVAVKE